MIRSFTLCILVAMVTKIVALSPGKTNSLKLLVELFFNFSFEVRIGLCLFPQAVMKGQDNTFRSPNTVLFYSILQRSERYYILYICLNWMIVG